MREDLEFVLARAEDHDVGDGCAGVSAGGGVILSSRQFFTVPFSTSEGVCAGNFICVFFCEGC